jgi:hypothetical protein
MPDMDSLTEVTGIDIEVVIPEGPGETTGLKEGGEEVKVNELPAALASKPAARHRSLRERRGRCRSGSGVGISSRSLCSVADR